MNPGRLASAAIVVLMSLAAVAAVALGVIGLRTSSSPASPSSVSSAATGPPSTPTAGPPAALSSPSVVVDGTYDTSKTKTPTADKPQSKLWFADGIWWGILADPVSGAFSIERLDWATQRWTDTGTPVDERPSARMDALWDGTHLYVVSAGSQPSPSSAARLSRFSYDPAVERYARDPNFPVSITTGGVGAIVLAKDSTGRLWVSYIADRHLQVNRSVGSDVVWGQPFVPPVSGTSVASDQAAIVSLPGRIGLMWTNQAEDALYFATHVDGTPDDQWQQTSTVISGLRNVDDHLSIKSMASDGQGEVFAAVKTSLDTGPNPNPLAAQVLLVVLDAQGTWHNYLFGRVKDKHTRPIVLLDTEHRVVYMVATSPFGGGTIYYKASSMDRISFSPGLGTPLIVTGQGDDLNNATSTEQNLSSETGFLVLASDNRAGHYVHVAASLGGPAPGSGTPRPIPSSPPTRSVILDQTFDPWPAGVAAPAPWSAPPADQSGLAQIVNLGSGNHAVRLTHRASTGSASTCALFPRVTDGSLVVSVDVLVSVLGRGDTEISSVGGPGGTAAAVRFGFGGVLAYYDGATRVKTRVAYRPGVWYRSTIIVHLDRRTYDWELTARGAARALLIVRGVHWRSRGLPSIDKLCLATPPDVAGASTTFDNVEVEH